MHVNYFARSTVLILIASLLLLCGCLGRSQKTRFYLLQATHSPESKKAVTATKDLRIGVGPVKLPEYLDRPQIVTQISESELLVDEFNQWAETLTFSISRVLAENLSTILSTQNLFIFPWPGSTQIDYQVKVDIIEFKGTLDSKVVLNTQYTILDGNRELLEMNLVDFNQTFNTQGYEGLVSSMNKALEQLSHDIAQRIKARAKDDTP